ncbi:MAG: efflux RND transporter periplasmic adaptor subunit [Candidatus Eremiobacteraeota bacterium]|nr:efflux RND transporter periplasmic adaptor subunit [Candidatus Eremiobacteraeota bacterium]
MNRFFAFAFGTALFTFVPLMAQAEPLTVPVGSAQATLQTTPDPPQPGKIHAVVSLTDASSDALAHTTVSFGTVMPSMSMNGPRGTARRTGPGRWEFDVMLGMAAVWNVNVTFSGSVRGTALYHLTVGSAKASAGGTMISDHATRSGSMAAMPGMSGSSMSGSAGVAQGGSMSGMAGMGGASSDAWRTAAFVLLFLVIIGAIAFALRRRSAILFGFIAVAAVAAVALALAQDRFFQANPAASMSGLTSDMSSMTDVHGDAPIPVTVGRVSVAGDADPDIVAPGVVAPFLTQDVVARAPGLLTDFSLYTGDRVRAGEVIAQLSEPELGSRAGAAAADAQAQAAAAEAAMIEAHHHAPNGIVIARDTAAATQRDLTAARADVSAKRAQVRYWQAEIVREKQLLDGGAVSQQEYSDERAQAAAAAAALTTAQQHVGSVEQQLNASLTKVTDAQADAEIMAAKAAQTQAEATQALDTADAESIMASYRAVVAPNDGVIVKRMVDPGVFVQPGTVIAKIAVIDRLRVQANVSQDQLSAVSLGTPLQTTLADGHVLRGRVSSIEPVSNTTTHTATVEAIVDNPTRGLIPGGFVSVTFRGTGPAQHDTMEVPSAAIVGAGNDAAVWTIVDGNAHRVAVNVISDDGTTATVQGHLTRGTRVAIVGASTLEEGQPVTASEAS